LKKEPDNDKSQKSGVGIRRDGGGGCLLF
jgi:hypothetical protein